MKVSVDDSTWQEPRFLRLCQALGIGRTTAVGTLVILWHATRQRGFVAGSRAELLHCLPWPAEAGFLEALVAHGYVTTTDDGLVEVVGNADAMRVRAARSQAGKQGRVAASKEAARRKERRAAAARRRAAKQAQAQAPKPRPRPKPAAVPAVAAPAAVAKPPSAATAANRGAWDAYSGAYQSRWGVVPARNAKVNAQIKQFVQRVGYELAPRVLQFYVAHNEREYLRAHHGMGPAVRDAEALVTQYHRDMPITSRDLQRFEEAHAPVSQLDRIARGEL